MAPRKLIHRRRATANEILGRHRRVGRVRERPRREIARPGRMGRVAHREKGFVTAPLGRRLSSRSSSLMLLCTPRYYEWHRGEFQVTTERRPKGRPHLLSPLHRLFSIQLLSVSFSFSAINPLHACLAPALVDAKVPAGRKQDRVAERKASWRSNDADLAWRAKRGENAALLHIYQKVKRCAMQTGNPGNVRTGKWRGEKERGAEK